MKTRYKSLKIALLGALTALTVAAACLTSGLFNKKSVESTAYAASTYDINTGSGMFYTSTLRGATISQSDEEVYVVPGESSETAHRFTSFKIGKDQKIEYRRSLAYSWVTGVRDDNPVNEKSKLPSYVTGADGKVQLQNTRFSMEIGFANTSFKRYTIEFQSQQNVYTKDEISKNYLVFEPAAEGRLKLYLVDDLKKLDGDSPVSPVYEFDIKVAGKTKHLLFSFGEYDNGDYPVYLDGVADPIGRFKNLYEYYAERVTSGSTACMPITFYMDAREGTENSGDVAEMIFYKLNGQSLEQKMTSNTWQITDDCAPVLCFKKSPSYLEYGKTISFEYKAIDVVVDSPYSTPYFYVLTGEEFADAGTDFDPNKYEYSAPEDGSAQEDLKWKASPFTSGSDSSIRIRANSKTFVPRGEIVDAAGNPIQTNVRGLVKVYYVVSDSYLSTGNNANNEVVFADWFVKDDALVNVYDINGMNTVSNPKYANFIKLIEGSDGATYAPNADESDARKLVEDFENNIAAFEQAYQQRIDDAIAAAKDSDGNTVGKLFAGSDNKFYLPSLENLVHNGNLIDLSVLDPYNGMRDYKYSLYYKTDSNTSSNTNVDFNKLAINLNTDGNYLFKIYISDRFGNPMRYPELITETVHDDVNGTDEEVYSIEWKELNTSDVWKEEYDKYLPHFSFKVSYKTATAEDPKDMSIAYVENPYSGINFKINGVADKYTKEYTLYIFDKESFRKDHSVELNYTEFTGCVRDLINNAYVGKDGNVIANTQAYFVPVKPLNDLVEGDENFDEYTAIAWNPSSVSFTPQNVDDFYVVELTLKDTGEVSHNYATVVASAKAEPISAETDWLGDNQTAVILLAVAAFCLLALVVLLVVKPKEKGDIDAVYKKTKKK